MLIPFASSTLPVVPKSTVIPNGIAISSVRAYLGGYFSRMFARVVGKLFGMVVLSA
jgi:hypothetical protein